jgi:hypothetical protein
VIVNAYVKCNRAISHRSKELNVTIWNTLLFFEKDNVTAVPTITTARR